MEWMKRDTKSFDRHLQLKSVTISDQVIFYFYSLWIVQYQADDDDESAFIYIWFGFISCWFRINESVKQITLEFSIHECNARDSIAEQNPKKKSFSMILWNTKYLPRRFSSKVWPNNWTFYYTWKYFHLLIINLNLIWLQEFSFENWNVPFIK